jgi:hypothetical protein
MRTAISSAAAPRRFHWQAAFTTKPYRTLTPIVWQHAFVSDRRMTNWSGGSDLLLSWVSDGNPNGEARVSPFAARFAIYQSKR